MKISRALELAIGVLTLSLASSCVVQIPPVPPSVQVGPAVGTPFGAEGTFERTLRAEGPIDLDVSTAAGEIAVRSHNSPNIRIVGRVHAYGSWPFGLSAQQKLERIQQNPPIAQTGHVVRIGHFDDPELGRNVSISYEVEVPIRTRLHSETGSGSVSVTGIKGPVDARTGSGNVRLIDIGSEVQASTGSGDIVLESIHGSARATSSSGSIRGTGIAGGSIAHTASGTVELEQTAPGDDDVQSGSGDVQLEGVHGRLTVHVASGAITAEGVPSGEWRLHAISGTVTVRVPQNAAFDLEASTVSGSIRTSHPVTVNATTGTRELRGRVRGGGPLVEASTVSGNVEIE